MQLEMGSNLPEVILPTDNRLALITLMTDFGVKDGNVGVMKGVIWGICPEARIADVSHMIPPQDVREAALILARTVPFFPPSTVHLVVVDPGVGTARRPMAARIDSSYYVGPDNGIVTVWLEGARASGAPVEFVLLDQRSFWLPHVSHVFHGRDIFAPIAANLAKGVALTTLGSPMSDPVVLDLPRPLPTQDGILGEIIHVDHFGNVASNIMLEDLARAELRRPDAMGVEIGAVEIAGLVNTFGERPVGETIALIGSTGNLIVSIVNGNAAAKLGIRVGDPIRVVRARRVSGRGRERG